MHKAQEGRPDARLGRELYGRCIISSCWATPSPNSLMIWKKGWLRVRGAEGTLPRFQVLGTVMGNTGLKEGAGAISPLPGQKNAGLS